MKQCSNCGRYFFDSLMSCPECGAPPMKTTVSSQEATMSGTNSSDSQSNSRLRPNPSSSYKNKNSSKAKTNYGLSIGGIMLIIVGIILFSQFDNHSRYSIIMVIISLGLIVEGILLLIVSSRKKSLVRKWTRYETLIDVHGNTRLSSISKYTGEKLPRVARCLQKMINHGYLDDPIRGLSAYIDKQYKLLVVTLDGEPIVPIEETMSEEIRIQRQQAEAEAERDRRSRPIEIEEKFLLLLDDAIKEIDDIEVVEQFESMKSSIVNIGKLIKEDPKLSEHDDIKNLRNSYIPSTVKLIDKYQKSTVSRDTRFEIKGMFVTIARAFDNIDKKLMAKGDLATEVDIDVLKQTLMRDGLFDSDFEL